MTFSLQWALKIAGFFFRSPTERAALKLGGELALFGAYVEKYPRLAQLEAATGDLAKLIIPATPPKADPYPTDAPQPDVQDGVRGGPRGGLMSPDA